MAAAPSGRLLKLVGKSRRWTSSSEEALSLLGDTQHQMRLLGRGALQGPTALEPVAFYGEDGEQKLLSVLGRLPLPSAAPSSDLRHTPPPCHAQISALLNGQVSVTSRSPCSSEVKGQHQLAWQRGEACPSLNLHFFTLKYHLPTLGPLPGATAEKAHGKGLAMACPSGVPSYWLPRGEISRPSLVQKRTREAAEGFKLHSIAIYSVPTEC